MINLDQPLTIGQFVECVTTYWSLMGIAKLINIYRNRGRA